MGAAATSFEVRTDAVSSALRAIERAQRNVTEPAGLMVFCAGRLARELEPLANAVTAVCDVPSVFAEGPGVLSERGELEQQSAATGIVWSGARAELRSVAAEPTTDALSELLGPSVNSSHASILFVRSEGFDPEQLWRLRARHPDPLIFGAGTYGDPGLVCAVGGRAERASAACLRLRGGASPLVRTAHSCRLLGPPMPITRARGAMIEEIDGVPALRMLERLGKQLQGQSLVFTVLTTDSASTPGQDWLVRGIQGVDPDRKALLISQEAQPDMHITFAVRESSASRTEFERTCRNLARDLSGAAPRFGLYFNCSGRGRNLYAAPNVDTRALRNHFGELPIAGFQSAFEIGPFAGAPALQLYTGIIAVFAAPS